MAAPTAPGLGRNRRVTRSPAHAALWFVLVGLGAGCRKEAKPAPSPPVRSTSGPAAREPAAPERPLAPEPAPPSDAASPDSAATNPPWPRHPLPRVETDWCTEGVSALDEQTCAVLPDEPSRTLLVYLHGVVPPTEQSPQKTNYQRVVARAARRAGAAALLPRGLQGTSKRFPRWWTWPMGAAAYRTEVPALMERLKQSQAALEELAGVRFERVYVAGSSAGAYFVAQLVLAGDVQADGYGAMSGGAGHATPELARLPPKPFYIGYGSSDSVGASARALGQLLKKAGWPVRVAVHPVPHGAQEVYLDEAFAFWAEHGGTSAAATSP